MINSIFSALTPARRLALLDLPTRPVRLVLDTDTYNEIDDQFALIYALLSPKQLTVEAVYAAPFHNERSNGPEQGMLRSYEEILRVLEKLGKPHQDFVFHGSISWLPTLDPPTKDQEMPGAMAQDLIAQAVSSAAAQDLIARARTVSDTPLYVVAIGAITNVASALLMAPDIAEKIVVVWLGGNPYYWPEAAEFNVYQDRAAARVVLESGVALVHVPCKAVTEQLRVSEPEMERFARGHGTVGDYLYEIFHAATEGDPRRTRSIWDLGPLVWLAHPEWAPSALIHSPILTAQDTWSHSPCRHFIREVLWLDRDAVFADFFAKLG